MGGWPPCGVWDANGVGPAGCADPGTAPGWGAPPGSLEDAGRRHMERDAKRGPFARSDCERVPRCCGSGMLKGKIGMAILVRLRFVFGRSQVRFGPFYHGARVRRFSAAPGAAANGLGNGRE